MPNTSRTTYVSTSRSTSKNTTRSTTTYFNTSHNTTTSYTTTYGTSRGTSRTTTYNTYYNTSHTTTYNTEWSVSTSHQTTAQTTTTFNTTYYTTLTQNTTIFTNTNTVVNTAVGSGSVTTTAPITRSTTFFRPKEVSQTNLMLNLDARVSAATTTWRDQSGNNRHATPTSISSMVLSDRCNALYNFHSSSVDLTGNHTGTENNITYASSNFGQGAVFNGSSSYVDATGLYQQRIGSTSLWFKRDGNPSDAEVLFASGYSSSNKGVIGQIMNSANSGKLRLIVQDSGGSPNAVDLRTSGNYNDNNWHHVVFVWDLSQTGSSIASQIYVDNSLVASDTIFGHTSSQSVQWTSGDSTYDVHIGTYQNLASANVFEGGLDQTRFFNKVLSASEVTQLYNENSSTFKKVDIFNDATDGHYNLDGTDSFYMTHFITDQNFTIGGWFYRNSAGGSAGYETLWSQGYSPSLRCQIYGADGSASGNRLYIYLNNGSSGPSYDTGVDIPTGEWFHLMKTYDLSAGTVKVYLNSALKKTQSTITGNIYSSGNSDALFRIAKNSSNNNGYINGKISQVRVYDSVLTDAQIIDDYSTHDYLYI